MSFTRDGRRLLVIDDALAIVDIASGETKRIDVDRALAAVGFVDQVWVAHGHDLQLARYAVDGRRLGAHPLSGDGVLVAAPVGEPHAVWSTSMLPLTARRSVTIAGARVVAPSGLSCELAPGSRVLGGAIILDGAAVVLLVERAGARELVVIGLSNGRIQQRQALRAGTCRVASRRGLVALQTGPRDVALLDLRSARMLGEIATPFELEDFALDPDGEQLAIRQGREIELVGVREALAPKPQIVVEEAPAEAPVEVTAPPVVPVAPAPAAAWTRPFDLHALVPREAVLPRDRASSLAMLDHEVAGVALWTLRAIAHAWDTRRLGFGNEGNHPFEHEVAALLGMNSGFARDYVEAAEGHLASHVEHDERAADAIARELGLSELAVEILMIVAAPALWSEAARLYGILANDPARPLVDEALVEQIIGPRSTRHAIAAELDPRSPLVRLGVIAVDERRARPFATLAADPIVLARLRCEVPDLGLGVVARGSDRALEEIVVAPGTIEHALDLLARVEGHARILVRGREGTGRRTLLAAIAAEANRALGVIDATLVPRAAIAGALRRAQLAGLVPCIVGLDQVAFGQREERDLIAEVLRAHPGPLALVMPPNQAAPLDAGYVPIDLPVLDEGERVAVWRTVLEDAGMSADATTLAARYRIGPGSIRRAVAAVDRKQPDALDRYIRQTRDTRLGEHARRVERLATWDNLVLPSDILDSLRELVGRVRHRRRVFEQWGMDRTMATSRGLTALFSGPPGTGKTLVAGVIARELGLDLYQIDLSKMMSKWIGETERNLGAIFDAAEDGQVILLFDEADSLFAKRTEVRSSNDRYANLEVNYLLQRLDSFEGIAVLTTNASSSIDPAFKRRLSFRLSFPFPDEETREQLWRAHLPATLPTTGPLALDKLAHKYQLSGGYIRNACLRAAFLAAQSDSAVTQQHLERAVTLEYAELGKLSNSGAID